MCREEIPKTRAPNAPRLQLLLEKSKSKKGHNYVKKNGELPALLVWVPPLIANN